MLPLIVTTGDNALHTEEMVTFFCDALDNVTEDAALGLTPASASFWKNIRKGIAPSTASATAPSPRCNLYAILTPRPRGARVFNSGGQFGKKPRRLIGAFGLFAFLLYKSRLFTLGRSSRPCRAASASAPRRS